MGRRLLAASLALWSAPALALPAARLVARVDERLCVQGTLTIEGQPALVDPLALLPLPEDDLTAFRTFPGRADAGAMRWWPEGDGQGFEACLPRRYGALGALEGQGLWANGGWHPQPSGPEGLPALAWEVELTLPEGVVGTLNGALAEEGGRLGWSGEARRLSLALLVGGEARELAPGLVLLERGPRREGRDRELVALRAAVLPEAPLVVVETPDWRRLVRAGEGVLYLSEAAFRLSPPLRRFHRQAVAFGLLSAALPVEDPWLRALAAAPLSRSQALARGADDWLRFAAWLPWVDALLYNGRANFHSELFGEVFPADPLQDDLAELLDPRTPPAAVAAKLDDARGPGAALALAEGLVAGLTLEDAAARAGLGVEEVLAWARPYPTQDLRLEVGRAGEGWEVQVVRDAPADAPAEPVLIEIDGELHRWLAPPGPASTVWPLDARPQRVVLDPAAHVAQTSRLEDAWPARWSLVGTVYPTAFNLSSRTLVAVAAGRLRRTYDTRRAYDGLLWVDEQTTLGAQLRYVHYAGPLLDRRVRPHRLSFALSPALLSPRFRPTDEGRLALEAGLGWSWDSRVNDAWPTEGGRLSASVDAGLIPGSEVWWGSAGAGALGVFALHPRLVLVARASGGLALGEVDHRLLALGGASAMRGLPANLAVGRQRALATVQLRALPIRDLSLPLLGLTWLDEVALHGGLELGALGQGSALDASPDAARGSFAAVGWMGGVVVVADGFGTIPGMLGLTFAQAAWRSPGLPASPVQVLLRFGHEF